MTDLTKQEPQDPLLLHAQVPARLPFVKEGQVGLHGCAGQAVILALERMQPIRLVAFEIISPKARLLR